MSESPDPMNIPIAPERLLAALLRTTGSIEISVDDLVGDYTNFQISVAQERDGFVIFELTEANETFE
jgi:hypothetical protein